MGQEPEPLTDPLKSRPPTARHVVHLVKLGGSVLTEKGDEPVLREDVVERLAQELAAPGHELVIVHGAGSFGHPIAQEHYLDRGVSGAKAASAAATVHRQVRELDLHLLEALGQAGLAPVSLAPFGQLGASDGAPGAWNMVPVHRCLGLGFTPVTFGDVVLDTHRGATVVSGDQLMVELARFLDPDQVIFVLDEDGVHDKPPADGGNLQVTIDEGDLGDIAARSGPGKGPDVTGGMAGKLAATGKILRYVDEVAFVNGLREGRLEAALGGSVQGTLVLAAGEEDA